MGVDDAETLTGTAAGVPYLARPAPNRRKDAPLVLTWHLMDPPRSEAAMAAALPLNEIDAWRVYLGLPMFGERAPTGGPEEFMRLAAEDYVLKVFGPVVDQAAGEASAVVDAFRREFSLEAGSLGLVGGSAGGAVVLKVLAARQLAVAAAALVNPVARVEPVVEAGERAFGVRYSWTDESRAVAGRFDFVTSAVEIAKREPQTPVLLVEGAEDEPGYRDAVQALRDALKGHYTDPDRVGFVSVSGMAHALADEPGMEPAPQTTGARQVDAAMADWFNRYL
jgi:dienelactone hydrolase